MQENWFESWFDSPYYHKLYFERDHAEAALFIDEVVEHLQPAQGSSMLDVACGKGRHSRQLAYKGFDVSGIDLSEESISEAKKSEGSNLHFYVHDMRLPFFINYFDVALNLFTSFGYFKSQRENDNAIRTISKALKPGGVFVFDYLNADHISSVLVPDTTKIIGATSFQIKKWQDQNHFYKSIEVSDPSLKSNLHFEERVAKFYLPDFKIMFEKQGLQIQEIFGDYALNNFEQKTSPRLVIIAKKII